MTAVAGEAMRYTALKTVLSESPVSDPIAFNVKFDETGIAMLYVVPWVHVPAPFAVGVLPSVV